jgi:hypothetical protein
MDVEALHAAADRSRVGVVGPRPRRRDGLADLGEIDRQIGIAGGGERSCSGNRTTPGASGA